MKEPVDKEFVGIISQYSAVIYRVASFYADEGNPLGDLYQEIVVHLWKGYPSFRGESAVSTWIYRVALNTCLALYRSNRRRPQSVTLNVDLPEREEDREMLAELYDRINRLKRFERALILLYLEDRSYQEIAEITGLSVTNVATKLSRIREKLKNMDNGIG